MKRIRGKQVALCLALTALLVCFGVGNVLAQEPSFDATYGWVQLQSGFLPDPFVRGVVAGGELRTDIGGVPAYVAQAPDFKLYYTAGSYPLTIRVESEADTTLLINLPDGSWIANDDGGGNLNPRLRFALPQSGRYDVWVGTYNPGYPPARLIITERE